MSITWIKNLVATAAVVASSASFASVITDVETLNTYVGANERTQWTHNINDNGFELGSAVKAFIEIDFSDDAKDSTSFSNEFARIKIEISDLLFGDDAREHVASYDYGTNLSLTSLVALNADGYLDVFVRSLYGDFVINSSTLTVYTQQSSVSEPASLALFGLGLMGLGVARRRSK